MVANVRKRSQMVASRRKDRKWSQTIANDHKHIVLLLTAHLFVCAFSLSILQAVKNDTLTQCRANVGPPFFDAEPALAQYWVTVSCLTPR